MIKWEDEIENIKKLIETKTLWEIGKVYSVSRQRIYQVLTKFGISTLQRERNNWLRDQPKEVYWLNKTLCYKGITKANRDRMLKKLTPLPVYCPALGLKLDYSSKEEGFSRNENSPSMDQIIPGEGYTEDNVAIISWRANRIKNDGTANEHQKISDWINNALLTK